MSTDARSRFGILSPEILPASELLPLIDTMTLDEQIIVVGKLRALEVILVERIMHQDRWHPHHAILSAVTERPDDELLDAKEASRVPHAGCTTTPTRFHSRFDRRPAVCVSAGTASKNI